mgnify:CR=1 FL=1
MLGTGTAGVGVAEGGGKSHSVRRIHAERSKVAVAPSSGSQHSAYDGVRSLGQGIWVPSQLGCFILLFIFVVSEDSHSRMGGSDVVNGGLL